MSEVHVHATRQQQADSSVDPELLAQGLSMIQEEKEVRISTAIRNHWRAMAWSITLSFALVMDGYDGSIAYSFYALPAFQKRFGQQYTDAHGKTSWIISANWQTAIGTILLPGNLLALFVVGWASERFGFKRVYAAGMILISCLIFMFVFLQNIQMMVGASALSGFCWGLFPGYAIELCPIRVRGIATSFISFAWGSGAFIASGVVRGALDIKSDWAWRMPWCLQWVWPVPLFIVALLAPENPYWLVRKGRAEEAKAVFKRIARKGYYDHRSLDGYVTFIKYTDDIEKAEAKKGTFVEIFKGTNLRRIEAMLCVWSAQQFTGLSMTSYATQFFTSAGMSTLAAFNLNIVVTSMNLVGCILEFFIIGLCGRRPLLLAGEGMLAGCLLLIGILGSLPETSHTAQGIGAFMVMINLLYHATIGPITYTVAAELPSSRLRQHSIALGRAYYAACGAVLSQLTPRMVSVAEWNLGGKAAYFYLGCNILVFVWTYFRLPETANLSFADLDILFANKVPARKFASTNIDTLAQRVDPSEVREKEKGEIGDKYLDEKKAENGL